MEQIIPTSQVPIPPVSSNNIALPSASKLFGQSWNIYKKNFGLLIGIYLFPVLLILIGLALFFVMATAGINLGGFSIILAIIVIIICIYVGLWSTAALVEAVIDVNQKITILEAYGRSRKKFWIYFGTTLLAGLAILGGTILLVIPGIIFAVWFSFAGYVVIAEGFRDTKALSISKSYVKGKFGSVLWRWVYLGIFYIISAFIIAFLINFLPIDPNRSAAIGKLILAIIWTPFETIYGFLLYSNLKGNILQSV